MNQSETAISPIFLCSLGVQCVCCTRIFPDDRRINDQDVCQECAGHQPRPDDNCPLWSQD